jgi:hypothetical protein
MAETRSFLNLVVTAIVTLSSLLVFPIVYRLWLHPLRRVPGPRLAAITTQWQVRKIRAGKPFLQDVHEKYGPVVRIGPNRISVSSEEGFNKIYSKCHKQTMCKRINPSSYSRFHQGLPEV